MFKKGDYVFHNKEGMQYIEDIIEVPFNDETKIFYVLKPVYSSSSSSLQLPIELEYSLRYPMTKREAKQALKELKKVENVWVPDNKKRKELFNEMFKSGTSKDLGSIIYTIMLKKTEFALIKKALPLSDFKTLELAKKLIYEEFAYSLNIDYSKIEDFFKENIA